MFALINKPRITIISGKGGQAGKQGWSKPEGKEGGKGREEHHSEKTNKWPAHTRRACREDARVPPGQKGIRDHVKRREAEKNMQGLLEGFGQKDCRLAIPSREENDSHRDIVSLTPLITIPRVHYGWRPTTTILARIFVLLKFSQLVNFPSPVLPAILGVGRA